MTIASDNLLSEEAQRSTLLQLIGTPAKLTVGAASTRVALPTGVAAVRLACTGTCWIKFGDSAVTAANTDTLFPAGAEVMKIPAGATYIAAIQEASGSVLSITGLIK